jgi:transketolase
LDNIHGLDHFGYSAPYKVLDAEFGYNGETVYNEVMKLLGK